MNKSKNNYSLSDEVVEMLNELTVDTAKSTGRGNKSFEVEMAIRKEHKRRFDQ